MSAHQQNAALNSGNVSLSPESQDLLVFLLKFCPSCKLDLLDIILQNSKSLFQAFLKALIHSKIAL